MWFLALIIASFFGLLVLFAILYLICPRKDVKTYEQLEPMFIFGSGGHTSEMCQLMKSLDPVNSFAKVHLVVAKSDRLSLHKISNWTGNNVQVHLISRSRSVGQSWFTTLFTFALSTLQSIWLIVRTQPHLVVANGPGTCVPICLAAKFLPGKRVIIFVESICRVKSLSLSGKILYPIVDTVVVQWPRLKESYPRAEYLGPGLI